MVVPENLATPEQQQVVDRYLVDIQGRFMKFSVDVDVKELPLIVVQNMTKPDAAAECILGSHIQIRQDFLQRLMDDKPSEPEIFRIILHEMGHCYFDLGHYEKKIKAPEGYDFLTTSIWEWNGKPYFIPDYRDEYAGTVMASNKPIRTNSDAVRDFYVKEVAGLADGDSIDDFVAVEGIELVEEVKPEQSDFDGLARGYKMLLLLEYELSFPGQAYICQNKP